MADKIGKYDIVERIGRGGMGTVYKARDTRLNRFVAIKVISPDIEITDDLRARFISEAQACAGLRHQNIVTIYDVGEEGERIFLVMELLDGQELKRLIADRAELDIEEKVSVMVQLCDALHYAHRQGIVHRDIKPGNVVVQRDGSCKIIDFGIAKMAQSASATRTGLIMGTIKYMSPEQVRGRADARSDQYSLGAVCYEMLAFRPPFVGDDPIALLEQIRSEPVPSLRELDATIPEELARIVERAIRRDPVERFADLGEMKSELEELQHALRDQSDKIRRALGPRLKELRELISEYGDRVGPIADEDVPTGTERTMRLGTLQRWDRQIDNRLDELRRKLVRASELESEIRHAEDALRAGNGAEAVALCETILADLPEHAGVQKLCADARELADAQRREQLARKLLDDARVALDENDFSLSLSILDQAKDLPLPESLRPMLESLRTASIEARDRYAQLLREAQAARDRMTASRGESESLGAMQKSAAAWAEAERTRASAEASLTSGHAADALKAFGGAAGRYDRIVREIQELERQRREAEEAERRRLEEIELRRRKEEERKAARLEQERIAREEAERRRLEAEAREAERKRKEAEARERREAEERERRKKEAEARQLALRKQEEEKKRRKEADEAARRKKEAEAAEAARWKKEAEAESARRKTEAEAAESARRAKEAEARRAEPSRTGALPDDVTQIRTVPRAESERTSAGTPSAGAEDRTILTSAPVQVPPVSSPLDRAMAVLRTPAGAVASSVLALMVILSVVFLRDTGTEDAAVESPRIDLEAEQAEAERIRAKAAKVEADAAAAKAQAEAAAKAEAEAAAKAQAEADAKVAQETEKARLEAEAKTRVEEQQKRDAEMREAEAAKEKARVEAEARAKAEEDARTAEAARKAEDEQKAAEAARKAKADADARAKAEADKAAEAAAQNKAAEAAAQKERAQKAKEAEEAAVQEKLRKAEEKKAADAEKLTARAQAGAATARTSATTAKSEAARANAKALEPALFAKAESSEKQATRAFEQSNFAQAEKLYAAAAKDYRDATERSGDRRESLTREFEKISEDASTKRIDAMAAGAGRFASDLYGKGGAKQEESKRLARDGNLAGAIAAQRAAMQFYEQARTKAEEASARTAAPATPAAPAGKSKSRVNVPF